MLRAKTLGESIGKKGLFWKYKPCRFIMTSLSKIVSFCSLMVARKKSGLGSPAPSHLCRGISAPKKRPISNADRYMHCPNSTHSEIACLPASYLLILRMTLHLDLDPKLSFSAFCICKPQ
jgi:hypothetical protein